MHIDAFDLCLMIDTMKYEDSSIPVMVTAKFLGYSSSIHFMIQEIGEFTYHESIEIGNPMTLCRL